MIKKFLIVSLLLMSLACFSEEKSYGNVAVSKLIRVSDGDTFVVDIKDYPDIVGKNISIRIYGIDTPEKLDIRDQFRQLALKAKVYSISKLTTAKTIELKNMKRDKYFRILADVFVDGEDLGKLLIANGYAKAYFGGHKEW